MTFFLLLPCIDQTNWLHKEDEPERVYQNYIFHDPLGKVLVLRHYHFSHIVEMHNFFKNPLLYCWAYIKQTKYKVIMTKEWSTNIANFVTPSIEVIGLDCGRIGDVLNILYFLKIYILLFPWAQDRLSGIWRAKKLMTPKFVNQDKGGVLMVRESLWIY